MPGKKITDHQVQKYKQHRQKLTQVVVSDTSRKALREHLKRTSTMQAAE